MKYDIWREIEPNTFLMFLKATLGKGTNIHWQPTLLIDHYFKATHLVNVKKYSKDTNTIKIYPFKTSVLFCFVLFLPGRGVFLRFRNLSSGNSAYILGSYYH